MTHVTSAEPEEDGAGEAGPRKRKKTDSPPALLGVGKVRALDLCRCTNATRYLTASPSPSVKAAQLT